MAQIEFDRSPDAAEHIQPVWRTVRRIIAACGDCIDVQRLNGSIMTAHA